MNKTIRIVSVILIVIPSLMLVMSGVMKLLGTAQMTENLGKIGLAGYMQIFGLIELAAVTMLLFSKTRRLGFLLICCYLGGALAIELSAHQPPVAAMLLALMWTGMYLRERVVFLPAAKAEIQ